jgi:poly(hydroxyalkanoate) depolymerase family esterase
MMRVKNFGLNPGNLNMYLYQADSSVRKQPIVIVLHGCNSSAENMARLSEWNKAALQHKFLVIYPQQIPLNNASSCFNWFLSGDQHRGDGEPESIANMVLYTIRQYHADSTRVYITGISAGAAMADIMLTQYPEIFKSGSLVAGGPAGVAYNLKNATAMMKGTLKPDSSALVRNNHITSEPPSVIIFHGLRDKTVHPENADWLKLQFLYWHKTDTLVDGHFVDTNKLIYQQIHRDSVGKIIVKVILFEEMGHALPVNPGTKPDKGGQTGLFAKDVDLWYVYETLRFWGFGI